MERNRPYAPDDPIDGGCNGYDLRPARIELTNGDEIHADHHFRTEGGDWVCAYVGPRKTRIDYRVPREQVVVIDTSPAVTGDRGESVNNNENAEIGETVESSKLREIAREWIAAQSSQTDVDDVIEYTRGVPSFGVSFGNTTRSIDLTCIKDSEPGDEIPVTATLHHDPGNAPRCEKTVKSLINDLEDDAGTTIDLGDSPITDGGRSMQRGRDGDRPNSEEGTEQATLRCFEAPDRYRAECGGEM